MSCHCTPLPIDRKEGSELIALVGNPNVGKSVIFQALTNMYVEVSNFPGTTLDVSHGNWKEDIIVDSPGIYGISSFNDEERVARDVILQADRIVNVVNAANLDRDLFLTQHLIDTGKPVVVVLNMLDEAKKKGLRIDVKKLSDMLGVPVVETVAIKKTGIRELTAIIKEDHFGHQTPRLTELLKQQFQQTETKLPAVEKMLLLEGDENFDEELRGRIPSYLEEIYSERRARVDEIINAVALETGKGETEWGKKLGHLLLRPSVGIPFLLLMLFFMYEIIGVVVAGTVVGFTEETIMLGYFEPFVVSLFEKITQLPKDGVIGQILVGEFGVFTMTFVYVLGLLFPLVFSFYLFLSLFEDSGYLPRLAALVDRMMQKIGLNGRAIIPMILGLGCVTMATITTRMLATDREKKIAIFLLGLAIPCSAQLAVIFTLLSGVGVGYVLLYAGVLLFVLALTGQVLNLSMKGEPTNLLIDIPPMRWPRPVNVLKKTWIKTYHFLAEAFPLFALGAFLITTLQLSGLLEKLSSMLAPVTVNWLGLPAEASTAFVMGVIRRDFGAAGLYNMGLTSAQSVIALITITLFVPCIASVLTIFKERQKKEAFIMWGSTFLISFVIGGFVNKLLSVFSSFNEGLQVTFTLISFVVAGYVVIFLFRKKLERRGAIYGDVENSATGS